MKLTFSILFAIIYTIGYVFLAAVSTGGGHGNFITLFPIPIWFFNFVALFLLCRLEKQIIRIFFVVMMLVHYLILFFIINDASTDKKMWTTSEGLLLPAIWFFFGQLVIWAVFVRKAIWTKSLKLQ